jgi:hypothetical protein
MSPLLDKDTGHVSGGSCGMRARHTPILLSEASICCKDLPQSSPTGTCDGFLRKPPSASNKSSAAVHVPFATAAAPRQHCCGTGGDEALGSGLHAEPQCCSAADCDEEGICCDSKAAWAVEAAAAPEPSSLPDCCT